MSDDLLRKFQQWDAAISGSAQGDWRDEARLCFAMVAGDQVPKDDADAARESGVLYAVLNKIDPTVSAICGSEITNRQAVRYLPRQVTPESAQVNEMLTAAAEWSRDECDAPDEESEAFRDCVTCGMGWAETRMDYDTDQDGTAVTERIDPLEMAWDPSSRRPNLTDARYLRRRRRFSKEEAEEKFGIDADAYPGRSNDNKSGPHDADPMVAYQQGDGEAASSDELEVMQYQWWTLETVYRAANPKTNELEELTEDEFAQVQSLVVQAEPVRKRVYYGAFRIGDEILNVQRLSEDEFTIKCVTGKLDRNKGVWYGVVRSMIDPQRLLNKQVSQLQRIIDTTAKGGLLAEVDAFEDPEQARYDWSASDTIVFTRSGAVSGGKVTPKPVGNYPPAIDKSLALMNEMVPGVSGVNNEMLGVIDRQQAGVVEWQRKQAAYGVLASFFNSLRRYRRSQGRLLLKLITKYMSDGRLIRIAGPMGDIRYVQLVRQPDVLKYDVIVDEAPAGPNQKERTFLFLMQFGQMLANLGLPPEVWMKLMEYSPLPASLVAEIQKIMQQKAQEPQAPDPKSQAVMAKVQADIQAQQAKMQMDQQARVIDFQSRQQDRQAQMQADVKTAADKAEIARMAAERDADIKEMQASRMLEIQQAAMQAKAELAEMQFNFERQMQEREASFKERMAMLELQFGQKPASAGDTQFGGEVG